MGGGDLNLKKSWHPLLMKNQERVWKQERAAIDERKRVQQLVKEKEEERQIQELQRLGGKKDERVEWLYNAAGASGQDRQNEEMEAYLLGKKSVEGIFKKQDEAKLAALNAGGAPNNGQAGQSTAAASGSGFQAVGQNPNSMRDLASKVREDPLLAIRKQEQAAYEQLMKDPKRLQKLKEQREGKKSSSSKKDKKDRHREHKHSHRHRHRDDDRDRDGDRDRDADGSRSRPRHRSRSRSPPPRRRDYSDERADRSPPPRHRDSYTHSSSSARRDGQDREDEHRSSSRRDYDYRRKEDFRRDDYRRSSHDRPAPRPAASASASASAAPPSPPPSMPNAAERLAAMSAGAASLESSRNQRLAQIRDEEAKNQEREARERMLRKDGLDAGFVRKQKDEMWDRNLSQR